MVFFNWLFIQALIVTLCIPHNTYTANPRKEKPSERTAHKGKRRAHATTQKVIRQDDLVDQEAITSLKQILAKRAAQREARATELKAHARRRKQRAEKEGMIYKPNPRRIEKISDAPLNVVDLTGIELRQTGYPTFDAIKQLVAQYWPGLGDVTIKTLSGGANTGIIYGVFNDQNTLVFVFKISTVDNTKKHQAWENLVAIQESRLGRLATGLRANANSPIITTVEKFFRYFNRNHQRCIIEVTHAAQGKPAYDVISGKITLTHEELVHIGSLIGKALGTLHRSCIINTEHTPDNWLTVVHGDFHANNVFVKYFESETGVFYRIYLIDNETMRHALDEPQKIDWDILEFIFLPILYWRHLSNSVLSNAQWSNNLSFYRAFLNGYVQAFPEDRQEELNAYLNNIVRSWVGLAIDIVQKLRDGKPVDINSRTLRTFVDSEPKSATWEGFIDFVQQHKHEANAMIERLQMIR